MGNIEVINAKKNSALFLIDGFAYYAQKYGLIKNPRYFNCFDDLLHKSSKTWSDPYSALCRMSYRTVLTLLIWMYLLYNFGPNIAIS